VPQTAPNLHVSQHPAVLHKLAILRDEKTEPKKFREVVRELSWLLGYEALADVRVKPLEIRTPMEPMTASELAERVGFVPILRAGLGMVDAMLELMADSGGLAPRPVPRRADAPPGRVLQQAARLGVGRCLPDPRPDARAPGGRRPPRSRSSRNGARSNRVRIKLVNLIAAPEGVAAVTAAHPDVEIHCAALDRQLNDKGYIMPGLGDAGDRQFGTGKAG